MQVTATAGRAGRRAAELASPTGRRNALVRENLPLVRAVVARFGPQPHLPYEDLVQVGSLGLLRAVEAFDPDRAVRFSSFAVPYIRGALLHELRDRQPMVRLPRSLWELRQQASRLQEERRLRGQPPLATAALAAQLGCPPGRLDELTGLGHAARPRSLDAPLGQEASADGGAVAGSLLDRLADPRSLVEEEEQAAQGQPDPQQAERAWLQRRLAALDPQRRALLDGRLRQGSSWVELGRQLGIHPRMAQRRCDAALAELRQAAQHWRDGAGQDLQG